MVHTTGISANIWLDKNVNESDQTRVGGKAIGLTRLLKVDANVPQWIVIDVEALSQHLKQETVAPLVQQFIDIYSDEANDQQAIDAVAIELRTAIEQAPVDYELIKSIAELAVKWLPVAVRSSAVNEDGAESSFAGIYESYLYLNNTEAIIEAIKQCWSSAFSTRALHYQRSRGMAAVPEVAVIIQEMAEGDISGVLFTVDPTSTIPNRALISACWGLGEGVVNGACAVDEFVVDHSGTEVDVRIADKDIYYVRDDNGGVREIAVEEERRNIRCLSPEQTKILTAEGMRIADALGAPQDIEWTMRGGIPVIVQTRPITALVSNGPLEQLGDWRTVWDNSNIQESFNGVTLPLTFSWATKAYELIFRETLHLIGVSEATINANDKVLRNMIGLVSGRVYYNINNWYRVLKMIPNFDRNKEDVERMIGVENPIDFIEGINPTFISRIANIPRMIPVAATLGWRMLTRARLVDTFQKEVGAEIDDIREGIFVADNLAELLELAERGLELFDRWAVQILNDLYLSNQAGKARRMLAAQSGSASEEIIAGLLASEEAVESLQPTLILMRLAGTIRADEQQVKVLNEGLPGEAYTALCAQFPATAEILDDYIDRFGDRCMGEQKLETVSLRQDPSFVAVVLRNYVRDSAVDVDQFIQTKEDRQVEFQRDALAGLSPRARRRLEKVLKKARVAVRDRERMRLTRTRIVGIGRSVYLKIGELMFAAGQLGDASDVFYLTMEELQAFAEGRSITSDLRSLAQARAIEYAELHHVEPPNQFETFGPPYVAGANAAWMTSVSAHAQGGNSLAGTGCWPGVVEGEIRVVMDPSSNLDVRGKILTTMRTDPGWGPLFPSVLGILVERGSTLSHSAVLSRELGIPAIVGIPGLMATIRDGERVRLNGGTGIVDRLDDSDD